MKVLIVYVSKSDTVGECVRRLREELHGMETECVDLAATPSPDLTGYDIVIVGSYVRFGKLPRVMRDFVEQRLQTLNARPHALFYCCALQHESERYYETLFPESLRDSAFQTACFGGTLRYRGLNLFEKLLVRMMRNKLRESAIEDGEYTPTLPGILPETIGKMATYVRAEAEKLRFPAKNDEQP